jgi:phage-related tail fiber protein
MAQKKITDLQLRDNVSDELNLISDDGIQSYRVTSAQMREFILAANAVTRDKIAATERLPRGTILPFAGTTAPTGYLKCDGSAINRSTYTDLFAIIGESYGPGNGSTTFNLPDLRGVFLRGLDEGRGLDPSRGIGTFQGDAIRNITGNFNSFRSAWSALAGGAFAPDGTNGNYNFVGTSSQTENSRRFNFDASRVVPTDNENRPANVTVTHIIKF